MNDDYKTELRADKWHEMSLTQLNDQQAIIIHRMSLLRSIPPTQSTPGLLLALERALEEVNAIANTKKR